MISMEKLNDKIIISGEPFTFATPGEMPWRQTMMESIPENKDGKYSGVELKFHYVPSVHKQPLDVDNLCEPVFTILVGKKKYFGGKRGNIQWFKAEKIQDVSGKLELKLFEKTPEMQMNFVVFDEIYQGVFPKSATDVEFAEFVKNNTKERLRKDDECMVKIQFNSNDVNIGNISSGTVKPIIDCLYPVLGGVSGDPDDHVIRTLLVEKGISSIPQEKVRITISRY